MNLVLRIVLLVLLVCFFLLIFSLLRRRSLSLKYSLLWILSCLVMILIVLVPNILFSLSSLCGIVEPVNFVFLVQGAFLLVIALTLSVIVSGLADNIKRLTQSQALLERRVRMLEERLREDDTDPDAKETRR